jgi:hypothetical protein
MVVEVVMAVMVTVGVVVMGVMVTVGVVVMGVAWCCCCTR